MATSFDGPKGDKIIKDLCSESYNWVNQVCSARNSGSGRGGTVYYLSTSKVVKDPTPKNRLGADRPKVLALWQR